MCQVPGAGTWHLDFQVPGALCQVTWKVGKWGIPEKGYQNAVWKCLFQVASARFLWTGLMYTYDKSVAFIVWNQEILVHGTIMCKRVGLFLQCSRHGSAPDFMLLHGCWHLEKLRLGGGAGKTLAHNPDPGFPPAVPTHSDPLRQDPDAISLFFGLFHVKHWKSKVHLKKDHGNWLRASILLWRLWISGLTINLTIIVKKFLFKKITICNLFCYKTRPTKHHLHKPYIYGHGTDHY